MATYLALIHTTAAGFTVSFPDFPTMSLTANTPTVARLQAQQLLKRRCAEMRRRREEPPSPLPFAHIMRDPRSRNAVPLLLRIAPEPWRLRQIS